MLLQLDLSPKISSKLEKVDKIKVTPLFIIVLVGLSDSWDQGDIIRIDVTSTNLKDKRGSIRLVSVYPVSPSLTLAEISAAI